MQLIELGYFSKVHGIKGALVLKTQLDFEFTALKVVFVEVAGNKAPYFVEQITKANQGFIVHLEQVNQIDKANALLNKTVFVDATLIRESEEEEIYKNFEVIDAKHGSLGKVLAMTDNGSQQILELQFKGCLVLLPLVEDLIEEIDEIKKIIHYRAPEGLIELYLEEEN